MTALGHGPLRWFDLNRVGNYTLPPQVSFGFFFASPLARGIAAKHSQMMTSYIHATHGIWYLNYPLNLKAIILDSCV